MDFEILASDESELIETWPREIDHISPWAITQMRRCPEQFRRTVLLRERARPAAALIRGRAGHAAHEYNASQKIDSQADLQTSEVTGYLEEVAWPTALEDSGGVNEIDWSKEAARLNLIPPTSKQKRVNVSDRARGITSELVGKYHADISPLIQPVVVEETFQIPVLGIPAQIKGRVDLVGEYTDGYGQKDQRLIDHKFVGRAEMKNDVRYVQGPIYQLEHNLPLEVHFSLVAKNLSVRGADPASTLVPLSSENRDRLVRSLRGTMLQIAYLYKLLGPDQPWPDALTHDWACSYCGFGPEGNKTCSWWF